MNANAYRTMAGKTKLEAPNIEKEFDEQAHKVWLNQNPTQRFLNFLRQRYENSLNLAINANDAEKEQETIRKQLAKASELRTLIQKLEEGKYNE